LPPVISSFFPLNMIFVNPSDGLSFNVSSPSGYTINTSGIHVTLNGTDVSAGLSFSGSSSNKSVTYSGLQSNTTYNASISVTDVSNLTTTAISYFETTWVGIRRLFISGRLRILILRTGCTSTTRSVRHGRQSTVTTAKWVEARTASCRRAPAIPYRPDDAIGIVPWVTTRKDHYLAVLTNNRPVQ
jgi:hypothetical protein